MDVAYIYMGGVLGSASPIFLPPQALLIEFMLGLVVCFLFVFVF